MSAYRLIAAEEATYPISLLCRVLRVARSGFYAWRARPPSCRAVADATLTSSIRAVHAGSRGTYGAPRVHAELADAHAVRCGRKRVARLMRAAGLAGCHRRRSTRTTRRDEAAAPAPDLVRRAFAADAPDRLWVADITYLPTWQASSTWPSSWTHAADGSSGGRWPTTSAPSWSSARWRWRCGTAVRRPAWSTTPTAAAQYTSLAFGQRCRRAGVVPSMGSTGDAYDNALAESFFATLECELIRRTRWRTHAEARLAVFDYVEGFYNQRRRHSALGYLSPAHFETRRRPRQTTAA